ncbi:MAG: exopolysaccharide biosynthesis polyprenyl glycosylphosphotransferase [Polyangiaceae bacterium]
MARARAGQMIEVDPKAASDGKQPAFYKRRRKRDNEIGQILLRQQSITPEQLREALRIQHESGGHVGAILRRMGACDSRAIADALIQQMRLARAKGKGKNLARRARENPSIIGLHAHCRPGLVLACLVAIDVVSIAAGAAVVALSMRSLGQTLGLYELLALPAVAVGVLPTFRLHSVTPLSPPEEIRSSVYATALVFLGWWLVVTVAGHIVPDWLGGLAWVAGGLLSCLLMPIVRGVVRGKFSTKRWWGHAVVVLGAGKVGRAVVSTLQSRPQLGLKPVAILDDDPARHGSIRVAWGQNDIVIEPVREYTEDDIDDGSETPSTRFALEQFSEVEGVPVVGGLELAPVLSQRLGIRTAVVAMPEMDSAAVLNIIERHGEGYTNVLVIPDLFNLAHFGAPTKYLGGVLGIEVQRQLLLRGPRAAKRALDIVCTGIIALFIWPILLVLAVLVRLDSKGPIFYHQKRLGADGVRFSALKFRTMYQDAERRLRDLLASNPLMRVEYEQFHKLNNDPRVTKIGRILRKYSLDELPQLWNVLNGDMSLVGPRPYLEREIPEMNQKEAIILRVRPGITGIWQVTTRNESTFEQRVALDVEYVRNWSPWLDFYVLARTVPVVFGGTGS